MEPAKNAINNYPQEHRYTRWGLGASIGAHITVALIVFLLAYFNHIKSLRDFMAASMNTPPPPTEVEVVLEPDETPPPPTANPLFIKQILQAPKPIIIPKPKPKPVVKPQPIVPKHVTPSHVQTNAPEAQMTVGSGGLTTPDYPFPLRKRGITGTVLVKVTFDGSGHAATCDILSSSGSRELDAHTHSFVLENWHDKNLAGQTGSLRVVYNLQSP